MTRVFDDEPDERPASSPDSPEPPSQHSPGLGPTTWFQFAVACLVGVVVGWFVVETMRSLDQIVPVTPLAMSVLMALVGVVVGWRARVQVKGYLRRHPDQAATAGVFMLALGKTMIFTGALLAGGHLTYVLLNVGQWAIPMPRQRVIFGSIAVVSSLLLAAGGWLAERSVRVE
ncbi:DUF3180 domain-containing protein [Aestuariimicrobium sp. T2.26MG-19.2B]|uniref:DUF3180 domain-containing protein n=1 Tax=Aestuariimicrobium sp. T2.26MG-19.2B TaxID=3040679 RepID=UPI0024779C1F|nr:DUF3180 domain-containing protein [Aestuariimicrobium sp. T2.26MG-19.2B]CAI9404986.1 hypothetical protein AESSP_01321 [Aestuariimicrobium sp. T2.26MG-19.2B]